MPATQCTVLGCKSSIFNKQPGVNLYSCPTSAEMRNKWLQVLKTRCIYLDWSNSKVCSKHFQQKCFDDHRRLKKNAIPTIFHAVHTKQSIQKFNVKIGKALNRMSQAELMSDIKNSIRKLKEPVNLDNVVTDKLQCKNDATLESKLWLIIKKQEMLTAKLSENLENSKKDVEGPRYNSQDNKSMDQNKETHKFTIKCLQEKLATLEEQIEILTAVESR